MLLKLNNITKRYKNPQGFYDEPILENLCLEIPRGETISIMGPSGSGKSTLLNLIGGLDLDYNGDIIFENKNIKSFTKIESLHLRNKDIGFIFQYHYLLPQLSVLENILVPAISNKKNKKHILERGEWLLEKLGLKDKISKNASTLSGGEAQRVGLARAFINRPKLILADEPTGSLDFKTSEKLSDILIEINCDEKTSLIVFTHSDSLAKKMNNKMIICNKKLEKI